MLPKISSILPFLFLATRVLSLGFQDAPASEAIPDSIRRQQLSIEQQQRSVSQQLQSQTPFHFSDSNFFTPDPPPNNLQADNTCVPLSARELDPIIQDAARKQRLAASLIKAVIKEESNFDPCAVSQKGAQGLMQLMPLTAQQLQVSDPFNPEENIAAGAAYLRQMLDRYKGDLRLALIAYNAGPTRADRPKSGIDSIIPIPRETQNYIADIFAEFGNEQLEATQQPNPTDSNAFASTLPFPDLPAHITPPGLELPPMIFPPSAPTAP